MNQILRRCAVGVALLFAFVVGASAQNALTGRVTDENGNPLAGVYVAVKGTQNATSTDTDGYFNLRAASSANTLVFSMLGMVEQEIPIAGRSVFDVVMKDDATMLNETVVVGYGTMIKRELTSSVAQVGGEALTERATGLNVLQNMAGKMAGVQIKSTSGRPGGNTAILIRGIGSIQASTNPLYVVDGAVDVNPDMINSNDIESISVLKDAASAAMYGAKGANGVVLITTKSGQGSGQGTITYDGKFGVGFLTRKLHLMNSEEYLQMQSLAYGYSGQTVPHLVTPLENLFYYKKDAAGNYVYDDKGLLIASPIYDTDWWDEVTRKAITQDHNVSFSQRSDKSSVYASIGWQDVQGLVKTTYGTRLSATINATTQIKPWLDLSGMVSYARTEDNSADQEGTMQQGAVRNAYEMPPVVPIKYPDGTWGAKQDYPLSETASNPIHQLTAWKAINHRNYFLGNIGLDFHLLEGLTFTVKGNYRVTNNKSTDFRIAGMSDWSPASTGTQAGINNSLGIGWSNEDYFTYDRMFFDGKLKSNFTLGASWYYAQSENSYAGTRQMSTDAFEYHNLSAGTERVSPSSGYSKNTMNSYYFRTNQNWLGRYMLGLTMRVDGASNFGANRKYGFFPSVSAGWVVSEEPWFGANDVVNHLKLRASYGEVGNASIGNYVTLSRVTGGTMIMNDEIVSQSSVSTLGNSDLFWETAKQFDAGVDIAFLNDRIQLIADYYYKKSVDLLFSESIPRTSGYGSIMSNLGALHNTGFELTLNTHPIASRNFAWDLDFIYSTNRTIVDKLYGSLSTHGGVVQEGQPYMRWGMKKLLGTWSTEEAAEAAVYGRSPGDYKLEDVNQNGEYDDGDTQYVGMATPKGEISLVNNFTWKGLNLMVDIGAAWGFKVSNIAQSLYVGQAIYTNSLTDILAAAWTPDNQNTTLAQLRLPTDSYFGNGSMGTFFLEDGDFIRVRNIILSYDLKRDLLKNLRGVKGLILGVSVENPFIWTKYTGFDPEVGWGTGNNQISYDWLAYPKPTTITGNVKISF